MKKAFIQIAIFFTMVIIMGCVSIPSATSGTDTNFNQEQKSISEKVIDGATSTTTNSPIGGVIGQLLEGIISPPSIEGKWVYSEPTIQFESESLLAKAGGAVATGKIVEKVKPYYERIGIVKGAVAIDFKSDNSCSYTINGNTYDGTYVYNKETNVVEMNDAHGIKIIAAYATVSSKNLAISFDATKLLTLLQTLGASSTNTTVAGLTTLSKSFTGMKVGFLFDKE